MENQKAAEGYALLKSCTGFQDQIKEQKIAIELLVAAGFLRREKYKEALELAKSFMRGA